MLSQIAKFLYEERQSMTWLMPTIITVLIILIPVWGYISRNNKYVSEVLIAGKVFSAYNNPYIND